jgi:hypothetical protein
MSFFPLSEIEKKICKYVAEKFLDICEVPSTGSHMLYTTEPMVLESNCRKQEIVEGVGEKLYQ